MTPAHGIGGVQDLPVPLWLFYYGGAVVLVVSFIALAVLWTKPKLEGEHGRPLGDGLQRALVSPATRLVLGLVGVALFAVVLAAALVGDTSPATNIAPTFVYVVFWLGVPVLVVLLGNVWTWLNPWRALAGAAAWVTTRLGTPWQPPATYPERLGRWPGAALPFAFVALELAYTDPANPRVVALAIWVYSVVTWLGAATFGRDVWFARGDGFSVYFDLLARMSVFARRGDEIVVRRPLAGLALRDAVPGTLAVLAVMLGSVAFDGFSRTSFWQDRVYLRDEWQVIGLNLLGLVAGTALVALVYLFAVRGAEVVVRDGRSLRDAFLGSLVPIAFAYAVAHYFSLFVLQGQFAIPLASDPFGRGWDVFGTADFLPNLRALTPNTTWYVQVGALVVGHVLGLLLAHDRAVALIGSARVATRTQFPMLALMVLYTVGGLWILSRG